MDPIQMQPAPVSLPSAPGPSDAVATMSQEQMKTNLQDLMSKIDNKYQEFNTHKFSSDNKIKEQEGEALRQIFDLLESQGVDPSNVEEVRAFLDKIKEQNPELYQQIEESLRGLLGEDTQSLPAVDPNQDPNQSSETTPIVPPENMNIGQ